MKRALLTIGAVAAVALLLFPTAGSPFTDSPETTEQIVMSPAEGPNGVYAVPDGTDELRLDFSESNQQVAGEGVNKDSVTTVDNVFTVTYTGEGSATIWLETGVDDAWFYRGSNPDRPLEGETNSLTLATEETVRVGLFIDTTAPDHRIEQFESFEVHARSEGQPEADDGQSGDDTREPEDDTTSPEDDTTDPGQSGTPEGSPDDGEQSNPDDETPERTTGDSADSALWTPPEIDVEILSGMFPDGFPEIDLPQDETTTEQDDGQNTVVQSIDSGGTTEQSLGGTALWILLLLFIGGTVGAVGATAARRVIE